MPSFRRIRARRPLLWSAAALACAATCPALAPAATLSVAPGGSDAAAGSADAPLRTITQAVALAQPGDTVLVAPGRYRESVRLGGGHNGVALRGTGPGRPVVDGEGQRAFGFENVGADDLTIENFELTGQTVAGISSRGDRDVITGNLVHHVGAAGDTHANGVRISRGSANRVTANTIHHIGPGEESMGIWLLETRDAVVEGNVVSFVRKEGVRDWKGLDNTLRGNRLYANWIGISLNTSSGTTAVDNHVHDNVQGITVKHASSGSVLTYWQLAIGRTTRVWHNTVRRSSEASVWIGQSDAPLDHVDVRGNLFAGRGGAYLRDVPSLRGPDVVVDGNAYSDEDGRPRWLYRAGYSSAPGLTDWAAVRALTGWETGSGPEAQAGARVPAPAAERWTPYPMTPVASSSADTWATRAHLDETADGDQSTYWMTAGAADEHVVFDFGMPRTFDHLVVPVFSHLDVRNAHGYRFEVSDDGATWRTLLEGENRDTSQAANVYELARPATGRYLRYTMRDTSCASYAPRTGCGEVFVLSDVQAGLLGDAQPAGETTPPADVAQPAVAPPTTVAAPTAVAAPTDVAAPPARPAAPAARSSAPAARRAPSPCVAAVARTARLRPAGRLTLTVTCSQGAAGRGVLTVLRAGRAGTWISVAHASFAQRPGSRQRITVRLRGAALRAAGRGAALAVRVGPGARLARLHVVH